MLTTYHRLRPTPRPAVAVVSLEDLRIALRTGVVVRCKLLTNTNPRGN